MFCKDRCVPDVLCMGLAVEAITYQCQSGKFLSMLLNFLSRGNIGAIRNGDTNINPNQTCMVVGDRESVASVCCSVTVNI